ncbi:hypothetical protein GCM10009612_30090 [Streptomyces beijiangensis]
MANWSPPGVDTATRKPQVTAVPGLGSQGAAENCHSNRSLVAGEGESRFHSLTRANGRTGYQSLRESEEEDMNFRTT